MQLHQLEPGLFAAGQPSLVDLAELASKGVKALVDSRTDDHGQGGLAFDQVSDAATRLGLKYVHAPLPVGGATPDSLSHLWQAVTELPRPLVLFCRSGVRSASAFIQAQRMAACSTAS